MGDMKERTDAILAKLKQERDELALKIHLGKKEAAAEWERLEARLADLRRKAGPAREVAADTAKEVGAAFELAAEEIKRGYRKLRKLL